MEDQKLTKEIATIVNNHFLNHKDLSDLLKDFPDFDMSSYKKRCLFKDKKYCRTILFENEKFEIILIGWKSGQSTPMHDHSKNGCIMMVIEGEINEKRVLKNKETVIETTFRAGDKTYISNEMGNHGISNESVNKAISLHIYSPPGYLSKSIIGGN